MINRLRCGHVEKNECKTATDVYLSERVSLTTYADRVISGILLIKRIVYSFITSYPRMQCIVL
jgi:hypothetical protein